MVRQHICDPNGSTKHGNRHVEHYRRGEMLRLDQWMVSLRGMSCRCCLTLILLVLTRSPILRAAIFLRLTNSEA